MTLEAKSGVVDLSVKAVGDDDPGAFEAVLSNGHVDRDGEYFAVKALEPLPPRIQIEVDHELSVRATVGSGEPYYDGDELKVKGRFASTPLAQEVRTLVKEGHVDSLSIAFRNAQREKDEKAVQITKAELVNAAFVAFPANSAAQVLMVKEGRRNAAKDAQRIQSLHDVACELGAACAGIVKSASEEEDDVTSEVDVETHDADDPESGAKAPDSRSQSPADLTDTLIRAHGYAALAQAMSTLRPEKTHANH